MVTPHDVPEENHFIQSMEDFVASVIRSDGSLVEQQTDTRTSSRSDEIEADPLLGVNSSFVWPTSTEAVKGALAHILGLRLQPSDASHIVYMHLATASVDSCPR